MDATLQSVGIFTDLSIDDDHPRVELTSYDKGFINQEDEGKVGYYVFDCSTEQSVPLTRDQARRLYTLAYPMSWEDWEEENHNLCMSYA